MTGARAVFVPASRTEPPAPEFPGDVCRVFGIDPAQVRGLSLTARPGSWPTLTVELLPSRTQAADLVDMFERYEVIPSNAAEQARRATVLFRVIRACPQQVKDDLRAWAPDRKFTVPGFTTDPEWCDRVIDHLAALLDDHLTATATTVDPDLTLEAAADDDDAAGAVVPPGPGVAPDAVDDIAGFTGQRVVVDQDTAEQAIEIWEDGVLLGRYIRPFRSTQQTVPSPDPVTLYTGSAS